MRSMIFLPLCAIFILFSAFISRNSSKTVYFSANSKIVGLFDYDSLLFESPEYLRMMDSLHKTRPQNDSLNVEMLIEYSRNQLDLNKDTSDYSPLILKLMTIALEDRKARIDSLSSDTINGALHLNIIRMLRIIDFNISAAAKRVAIRNSIEDVIEKRSLQGYLLHNPEATLMNVTNDMRVSLGIKK